MIKEATKDNLPKRLTGICEANNDNNNDDGDDVTELGIVDDHEITVADQTSPKSIIIKIKLTCNME
jgi:hypothetical protein